MGEIRFVGTGETRGYPYLACKKTVAEMLREVGKESNWAQLFKASLA